MSKPEYIWRMARDETLGAFGQDILCAASMRPRCGLSNPTETCSPRESDCFRSGGHQEDFRQTRSCPSWGWQQRSWLQHHWERSSGSARHLLDLLQQRTRKAGLCSNATCWTYSKRTFRGCVEVCSSFDCPCSLCDIKIVKGTTTNFHFLFKKQKN